MPELAERLQAIVEGRILANSDARILCNGRRGSLRTDLEIFFFGMDALHVIGAGFLAMIAFCLFSLSRTGRRFPKKHLSMAWLLTVILFVAIPYSIRSYTLTRLTGEDNLFFLTSEAVGPSYPVLIDAYNRWSDFHLAILTGSIFIVPFIMLAAAHLIALLLAGVYRLFGRNQTG